MRSPARTVWLVAFLPMVLIAIPRNCLGQSRIVLRGVVPAHCAVAVSVLPAASVRPLAAAGLRRIAVGAILRNCNQKTGFTLTAASADGVPAPVGVVDFDKPATGSGAASGLIVEGTSKLYVNFFVN